MTVLEDWDYRKHLSDEIGDAVVVQARKERRERIATAVLTGLCAVDGDDKAPWGADDAAIHALRYTDALIKALDQ